MCVTEIKAWIGRATVCVALALAAISCSRRISVDQVVALYHPEAAYPAAGFLQPRDASVLPPDLAPITFAWEQPVARPQSWVILVEFEGSVRPMSFTSEGAEWTPEPGDWERIKKTSLGKTARLTVLGIREQPSPQILSRARVSFTTSPDPVGAPIFYREVNLPFMDAVKDPTRIRWRFGTIDSLQPPPVVLEHLPVCGNCHSFSRSGGILGMDVDYANNKGSYVITRVDKQMKLASSDIITWDDYRKEDGEQTFGLLSQVSPDGQEVISTVKDKSVFVAKPDLAFSQLFFPIKGILAVYHRATGTYTALPGADDPQYVQSNPVWSPDGEQVVFARAKAFQLKNRESDKKLLLSEEDCAEFVRDGRPFKFDLYRIPYNHGQGGKPEPLKGASGNGRSNYFPRYSPDGKWIVFCQASNYMLLQPDSELFIIPAAGGEARRLAANTQRMNSWHSWSPNGRWLVFSSKANSPYTQLFLTHMDAQGESTPPVLLSRFTGPDRAANIPEFVNAPAGAIARIEEKFLNDYSHARAGYLAENTGDLEKAIAEYEQALHINSGNEHAHQRLGFILCNLKHDSAAGLRHTTEALRLNPSDGCAHFDLGVALMDQGKLDEALTHLSEAVRLLPDGFDQRYCPAEMNGILGEAFSRKGMAKEAAKALGKTVALAPRHARAHYLLALSLAAQGLLDEALQHYHTATSVQPGIDTSPELHFLFSVEHEKLGQFKEALQSAEKALALAPAKTDPVILNAFKERVETCRDRLR
jgi:Tol biopolymer transport system component/Flp pilus assembly protein TadD